MSARAAGDTTLGGMSSVFGALSHAADLLPHEREDLRTFLWNRRALARQASKRGRFWLGRLYNRFAGEMPDYIELSGTHLKQVLTVAGQPVPDIIVAEGEYQLRLDVVEHAIEALEDS